MIKATRRRFIQSILFGGFFGALGAICPEETSAKEILDYNLLSMRLYAKTDKEKEYLKDVVAKVDSNTIARKNLYIAYQYAMKKDKLKRMIYFDRCLTYLCGRSGKKIRLKSLS